MADNEFIIDFDNYDESFHKEIMEYVKSLNEIEIKAMKIAQDHLETSFNIVKSIGFQKWKKNL
jgi:hypothetical protein